MLTLNTFFGYLLFISTNVINVWNKYATSWDIPCIYPRALIFVLSSIFRISRAPLQDSTMCLAVVIPAISILMKSINANWQRPIAAFPSHCEGQAASLPTTTVNYWTKQETYISYSCRPWNLLIARKKKALLNICSSENCFHPEI